MLALVVAKSEPTGSAGTQQRQTEKGQTEKGRTEKGQAEKGQTEKGQTEKGQTEKGQTEKGQTEKAPLDSDEDGVDDWADRCPVTAEDDDGFEDEDGCPESDNDDDGIPDRNDSCSLEAETRNAVTDDDGCPDLAPDADGDAVADGIDRCPFEPENIDGLRDEDGCPEYAASPTTSPAAVATQLALARILAPPPHRVADAIGVVLDSDKDGVDDRADRCPVTAEDDDQFEDEDGCPELDEDEDGIPDRNDSCPTAAETFNGWKDGDGCPDEHGDVDGDHVEFEVDRCPLEPGDASDGCPHLPLPNLAIAGFARVKEDPRAPEAPVNEPLTGDFDGDTVPDAFDRCPMSKEDTDGFEDEDGCAEPDNDLDGIDDKKDKCAFEAETINGNKDDDGCPDPGVELVHVLGDRVVIDETIQFKTASATLQPASNKILKQVASKLKSVRSISIEIQGHTDDVGSAATNIKLSQKRADAIRAFLIKAGVPQVRLRAKGFGPTRPRATNTTAAGREQNRRVDFLILGETK
jgi:outer membrane protein OmpA-like peptidoglycan-associated protein